MSDPLEVLEALRVAAKLSKEEKAEIRDEIIKHISKKPKKKK